MSSLSKHETDERRIEVIERRIDAAERPATLKQRLETVALPALVIDASPPSKFEEQRARVQELYTQAIDTALETTHKKYDDVIRLSGNMKDAFTRRATAMKDELKAYLAAAEVAHDQASKMEDAIQKVSPKK